MDRLGPPGRCGAGGRAQNSLQYICIPYLPPLSLLLLLARLSYIGLICKIILQTIFGQTFGRLRMPFAFLSDGILSPPTTYYSPGAQILHVLEMSTKAHLGFEGAFPFRHPSDNLRTLFGLFKMVSGTWVGRIELLDASQTCKKLASHI